MDQGRLPSRYSKPCLDANSEIRPRFTFFSSITSANKASVKPSLMYTVPPESESETTLAPKYIAFSAAYCATLPEPEMVTTLSLKLSLQLLSISSVKYTAPEPVASGRASEPPKVLLLPVNTHEVSLLSYFIILAILPTSRPPTPISPAGISLSDP